MHKNCACNEFGYPCRLCRTRMDAECAEDYANKTDEWTEECLLLIAKELGINLPEKPRLRGGEWIKDHE